MKIPNPATLKVIGQILNSRIGLALLVVFAMSGAMNRIEDKMDRLIVEAITLKEHHASTPDLLADIRLKIMEICGHCQNCEAGPRG